MWVSNQQTFEQLSGSQKHSWEDQITKLEESTRLYTESSTQKTQNMINSIDNLAQKIGQLTYQLAEQENDSNSNVHNQPIANPQGSKECSADQTLRWENTNDNWMEEYEIEEPSASDTCPTKETTLADPELSPESVITQVIEPPMPFSQRL
ncbi:hypothetical protein D8674_025451 [Pyrus ussuriensis x Pyrus communis]|uniref:Uncharacterized protein n=1 Tax=Pyrus ussuriensis x Pyrus communis TaxID=2448454 RepID=A0A5N5H5P1_9ROSA|nr:hypothetical protein D8674_025451 [Pyrus ussuriensis x Pyrus communis]